MAMFEVQHNHHGEDFQRFFHRTRSSMSAIEDKRAEEFRRHVWAVTMIDEQSIDLVRTPGPNKLRSRRATCYVGTPIKGNDNQQTPLLHLDTAMKDSTVAVRAVHPPLFGSPKDQTTLQETAINAFLANTQSPTQDKFTSTAFPRPTYAVLETPLADPSKNRDAIPHSMTRPRKLSNNSVTTTSSFQSRETMSSARRTPSWGSRTSLETTDPSSQWRPEYMYQRPTPIKKQSYSRPPLKANELFSRLPTEVLSAILEQLRDLHLDDKSGSCATCWMRDVSNISVSCRMWHKPAQTALYQHIQLVGPDSAVQKKKFKMAQGVRIMMLRRVLRSNPHMAGIVRTLKVPAPEIPAKGNGVAEYEDLVASLVMACPNLESLSGLSLTYDHSFRKIFHALSTRSKLKEMNWLIQASTHQRQQQQRVQLTQQPGPIMPEELKPFQEAAFFSFHDSWAQLENLTVHCLPGATLAPETLLTSTLSSLPNLKRLHLCNLPPNSFDDATLLTLPPLESLTLSHISGITSNGLSAFATLASSTPLRKLTLRHSPLTSLAALARILSNLRNLANFSLVQAFPPVMPENDSFALMMMPYLANNSIRKLHWDITSHTSCVNAADDILARSIAAGGFPALRTLRAPNDSDGIFQNLCYPVARIDLPSDRFRLTEQSECPSPFTPSSAVSPMSPTRLFKSSNSPLASPRTPASPFGETRRITCTNLHTARLAAQVRLDGARCRPRFTVNVIDQDGTTNETFRMAGFIGTAGSPIKYHLLPDRGTTDEKGGLIDVRDLDGDAGESLTGGREGCTGRWNQREGTVADKKEKEKWWHTERGRWTKMTL